MPVERSSGYRPGLLVLEYLAVPIRIRGPSNPWDTHGTLGLNFAQQAPHDIGSCGFVMLRPPQDHASLAGERQCASTRSPYCLRSVAACVALFDSTRRAAPSVGMPVRMTPQHVIPSEAEGRVEESMWLGGEGTATAPGRRHGRLGGLVGGCSFCESRCWGCFLGG